MNIIETVCRKLADLESYLNSMPIEKRKSFTIKVFVILLILLVLFTLGHKWRMSIKRDSQKEVTEVVKDLSDISQQVEEELTSGFSEVTKQNQKYLQMIDSIQKADSINQMKQKR